MSPKPDEEWPEPASLGTDLPPVASLTEMMSPERIRGFALDVAWRMGVLLDFVVICLLTLLSGTIQRRARIRLRALDYTWEEVFNLWGGLVGRSGMKKSPVILRIALPIYAIQDAWRKAHSKRVEQYELDSEISEIQIGEWRKQVRDALQEHAAIPQRPDSPAPPGKAPRIIVNDTTAAKAQELVIENPAGLLLIRDEMGGWWSRLDSSGQDMDRDFYMTSWSGNAPYDVHRIGRGEKLLPALSLSIFGALTPAALRSYIIEAAKTGRIENGFIQRFQMLIWPDGEIRDSEDSIPVDYPHVQEIFERATKVSPEIPLIYRFTLRAQQCFESWYRNLTRQINALDPDDPMGSHLNKYPKLMSVLAGIFAMIEGEDSLVDVPQAELSIEYCCYFETHARRIYSSITSPRLEAARRLAEKIKTGKIGAEGIFSTKDVYMKGWKEMTDPDNARAVLRILEEHNWIRRQNTESGAKGGRPGESWLVNPLISRNE
jgi:putative DNA primase/helicase